MARRSPSMRGVSRLLSSPPCSGRRSELLTRNSSCKRVEYAEWDGKARDHRLRTVAARCQVCLVQRTEELPDGGTRNTTSVWALSDDRQVRLQQKRELSCSPDRRTWGGSRRAY